ncbi:D-dopachrome decarboxylase-B-like [Oratosquilla oratoria]|uniref:D-dopachrome decarboxylase-B-like n=1 Tax=Oratosquilla oratoria TaxID=337810 RepID=UPI003F76088C
MPLVYFRTNLLKSQVTREFQKLLSAKVASTLQKPEERISVSVMTEMEMMRGGSFDPLCEIEISSIGKGSHERNQPYVETLTDFVCEHIGVEPKRVIFLFKDLEPHEVGFDGNVMKLK